MPTHNRLATRSIDWRRNSATTRALRKLARRLSVLVAAGSMAVSLAPLRTEAQLGFYQLPKNDFIWRWGNSREGEQHGIPDFDARGGEAGFQCQLTARLSVSNNLSRGEISNIENGLRTRMDFIYAATELMNNFDWSRSLDWATLDCKKQEAAPRSDEERAEREAAAREKMQREIERRRAKQRGE